MFDQVVYIHYVAHGYARSNLCVMGTKKVFQTRYIFITFYDTAAVAEVIRDHQKKRRIWA